MIKKPSSKLSKSVAVIESVPVEVPVKAERKKRVLSEEQRDVLRERLVKARSVRAEKRTTKVI